VVAHVLSDEIVSFLSVLPARTGKLATVRADGRPHVAPIWYDLDQDEDGGGAPGSSLVFNTGAGTVKGRNLVRDPRAAICIDDERPPFSFVMIEGEVELVHDLEVVRYWAGRIGGRYMGVERAAEYGARNGVPGELLVRLRPLAVHSAFDLAD
jgi:PPOX class probable F420-dependent enzyme